MASLPALENAEDTPGAVRRFAIVSAEGSLTQLLRHGLGRDGHTLTQICTRGLDLGGVKGDKLHASFLQLTPDKQPDDLS